MQLTYRGSSFAVPVVLLETLSSGSKGRFRGSSQSARTLSRQATNQRQARFFGRTAH